MKAVLFLVIMGFVQNTVHGQHSLPAKMKDASASVVIFLSPTCPITQKYIPALNAIFEKYRKQNVEFIGLIPGKVPARERNEFIRAFDVRFPVYPDKHYKWAGSMHAAVTPEVFLFDKADRLRYRGAIDNWFYDLGKYRSQPTNHYLINSLEDVLVGKIPGLKSTEATGCSIQMAHH